MSAAAAIALSPDACLHDLRLLLHAAPESVNNAFFDDDLERYFRGADVAMRKAEWCEAWARRDMTEYERGFFVRAAALLRMAAQSLPAHAPPDPPRLQSDDDYHLSVAQADRRYLRRRR